MDDLIRLIIFAFIFYAIFGSLFRKKKLPQSQKQFPSGESNEAKKTSSDSSAEILHDLFGIPLPKTGGEYENYPAKSYPEKTDKSISKIETPKEIEAVRASDINNAKLPSLEDETTLVIPAEQEVELEKAYEGKKTINEKMLDIKRKITNPISLRELYLISEIIKKPKALRR